MERILRVYNYSNSDIIKVSVSEPKFSERYRYYYNYIRREKKRNLFGDMRLNYPEYFNKKGNSVINFIKKFFGLKDNIQEKETDEFFEEVYKNVIVLSNCKKDDNEWVFNEAVSIYKEDIHFSINDEYLSLNSGFSLLPSRIIFKFHDNNVGNTNSDEDGNMWLDLDEVYKVDIVRKEKDTKVIDTDTIYFIDKEKLEEFLNFVQKYIPENDSLIVDDNTGKIIKKVV